MPESPKWPTVLAAAVLAAAALAVSVRIHAGALPGEAGFVFAQQKITEGRGGFSGSLTDHGWFGFAVESIGDLDGDGVGDLAVGHGQDDDGGFDRGSIWILFLNPDGTVKSEKKISSTEGGFAGRLHDGDTFGRSLAWLGDLDGDGTGELAVGARNDDDGGSERGAVWILSLHPDASIESHGKISSTRGRVRPELNDGDWFGISVTALGDVDGDGVGDLAASAIFHGGGGAVWVLFLNEDATVKSLRKHQGSDYGPAILFGEAIAAVGDVDGDGVTDLAVSDVEDDDGGRGKGAVYLFFLRRNGGVRSVQKISARKGDFSGRLSRDDHFGSGLAALGDLDGNGVPDLAVGTDLDDDGGPNRGAVWLLFLRSDGTVESHRKISDRAGGFAGKLEDEDRFGRSVAALADINGDQVRELAVGTIFEDGDGAERGGVWILFLQGPHTCGNGAVEFAEECDDGDAAAGDGCSETCQCEPAASGDLAAGCACRDVCGDPAFPIGETTAADAAHVLAAAVGSASCDVCVCDLDASGDVAASDALIALEVAVGLAETGTCGP